jgi:imidazolonepropionase-like amidohydrolase
MRAHRSRLLPAGIALAAGLVLAASQAPIARDQNQAAAAPVHAKPATRLLIKNAMVIYGNGKPAFGPTDILVRDGLIARIGPSRNEPPPDAVIDATGKYVMPGIVNAHMHLQDERGGTPQPFQYEANLLLACGITTVRDVGSDLQKAKQWRADSAAHTLVAPRIQIYTPGWRGRTGGAPETPETVRAGVRWAKENGADGIKIFGIDRDLLAAALDEAHKVGLPSAAHIAVEETTAKDFAELGVTSIEHFYGVADAALDGIQEFPPEHNASNEVHRFGRAGELYIQDNLNRAKLSDVLALMVRNKVAWVPTMSIYVAGRDVVRAQNLPWYKEYLHPTMEEYWKPDLERHGSFFLGWTSTQEARWRRSYQVWMQALREFGLKGGLIATGDDAGFIYSLYGFGLVEELALMEEAGFQPLEVLKHATVNGATLLGLGDKLGRVRQGYIADLLVVNGNPLEDLHVLNPYGADVLTVNGKRVSNYSTVTPGDKSVKVEHGGGIEWTVKDGIPYHVPTLMKEVKDMVAAAKAGRKK